LHRDFTKCNVLIYDERNNPLVNVKIWEYNEKESYIVVQDWPELAGVERCKLLILTAPAPYSYIGIVRKRGLDKLIKLYEEHMEENRREIRYKTDLPGSIESLIYNGKSYPLHTMLDVRITDISKGGMRILARDNTLIVDDRFHIHVKIGENDKLLTGKVVNSRDTPPETSEYGCRLVSKDGEIH
jgi:hypothetical protein